MMIILILYVEITINKQLINNKIILIIIIMLLLKPNK